MSEKILKLTYILCLKNTMTLIEFKHKYVWTIEKQRTIPLIMISFFWENLYG